MGSLTIRFAVSLALLSGTAAAQGAIFPANYWYPADNAPYGSRFADLNADGKQDHLVADYYTDKVSVYLGQGTGTLHSTRDSHGRRTAALARGGGLGWRHQARFRDRQHEQHRVGAAR